MRTCIAARIVVESPQDEERGRGLGTNSLHAAPKKVIEIHKKSPMKNMRLSKKMFTNPR